MFSIKTHCLFFFIIPLFQCWHDYRGINKVKKKSHLVLVFRALHKTERLGHFQKIGSKSSSSVRYLCMLVCEWWAEPCLCKSPPCSSDNDAQLCCGGSSCRLLRFSSPTVCTTPCWIGSDGRADCSCMLRTETKDVFDYGHLLKLNKNVECKSSHNNFPLQCSKTHAPCDVYHCRAGGDFPVKHYNGEQFIICGLGCHSTDHQSKLLFADLIFPIL